MPCGVLTATDVPDANLAFVMGIYQIDHPIKIEHTRQPNGKWTVVATFPPCAKEAAASKPTTFAEIKSSASADNWPT